MSAEGDRCMRCRGRMVSEQDWAGAYASCVMCGYVVNDRAITDKRFVTPAVATAARF